MQKTDKKLEKLHRTQGAEARRSFLQVFVAEARGSCRYVSIFLISSSLWIADSHIKNSSNEESFGGLLHFIVLECFRAMACTKYRSWFLKGRPILFRTFASKVMLLHWKSSMFIPAFNISKFYYWILLPYASRKLMFWPRKRFYKCYRGSSRKQFFRWSIRGIYAEGFVEERLFVQQFLTPLSWLAVQREQTHH